VFISKSTINLTEFPHCLGLFVEEKPPSPASPFHDLVFLLTYVEKSKDLREEEKSLLKNPCLTSDESSAEST
jgi:hypothetical protein